MEEEGIFLNQKVLITGGGGFIGFHLINRMLKLGAKVYIVERKDAKLKKLNNVMKEIEILEVNITDLEAVNRTINLVKPDYIFHLAAYGVNSAHKEYIEAVKTNIIGIVNLLEGIKCVNCKKFINMGSCAEYGDRKEILEEELNLKPVSVYGSTKAGATIIAHQIAKENNISIVTLRPFGIFGEGEDRHKIFCHVILSIIENKDVRLTACYQLRDYCYIENIIDGMLLAARAKNIKNDIFNIASGNIYPLKYYIELIFKNMETDKKPLYGEVKYRENEMWTPRANIKKISSKLNWEPKISVEDGLIKTIKWYKDNAYLYI